MYFELFGQRQQLSNGSEPFIIDVREPREFERGHIPGAHLLPLSTLLSEPPVALKQLPSNSPIICVCRSGRRAKRAALFLSSQGYEKVCVLRGGLLSWKNSGLLEAFGEEEKKQQLEQIFGK